MAERPQAPKKTSTSKTKGSPKSSAEITRGKKPPIPPRAASKKPEQEGLAVHPAGTSTAPVVSQKPAPPSQRPPAPVRSSAPVAAPQTPPKSVPPPPKIKSVPPPPVAVKAAPLPPTPPPPRVSAAASLPPLRVPSAPTPPPPRVSSAATPPAPSRAPAQAPAGSLPQTLPLPSSLPLPPTPPPPPARSVGPSDVRGRATQAVQATSPVPAVVSRAPSQKPRRNTGSSNSANSTLMGMPAVAPSSSLATRPYSRVIADVRVTAPSLDDRVAAAQDVIALCEKFLSIEKDKSRRARLHVEIARLHETTLNDLNVALTHFQKAHTLDSALETGTAGLARVRARLGQWEGVLTALEHLASSAKTPDVQASLLFSKAVILEMRLDRHADARGDYEKALALMPHEASLLSSVVRCARRDQDWKALDLLLAAQSQASGSDTSLAAARLAERARVAEVFRKQSAEAAQYYQQAWDTDPMASAAALALERLLQAKKQSAEHVKLLQLRAELIQDAQARAATLANAATVLAQALSAPADAAAVLELAWEAEPNNVAHLRRLDELYRECGDYEGVVRALDRIEQRTQQPGARARLCIRIAELLSKRLGQGEMAIRYWERARALDPADPSCVGPLCAHYEQTEAWGELVQVLSDEESASSDSERRAAAHCYIARLCELKLAAPEDAIEHYRAALGLVPEDENAFRELSRLLEAARRYEEVVELHERAAEAASHHDVLFVHLFKIGQMLEDLLAKPERAISVYQRVLSKQPNHLGALFALQRAASRAGAFGILVEALVLEAAQHQKPSQRVPLLHRAAEVAREQLGQEQKALELFTEVLSLDSSYRPTLQALVRLHEKAGRYAEQLKVLTLELNGISGSHQRAAQLLRLGRLAEEFLKEDEKALSYYKKAFEAQPEAEDVAMALSRCWTRLGRFDELAVFLQERIKKLPAGLERAEVSLRLGEIYELRLAKLPAALAAYEAVLDDAPSLTAAADARIRVLEQRPDAKKTVEALGERAKNAGDIAVRLWAQLRQAEILESVERTPDAAIAVYETIQGEHPGHAQVLAALERLYQAQNNSEQLNRILRLQAQAFTDAANKKGALRESLRLAETAMDEVGKLKHADNSEEAPQQASTAANGSVIPDAADVLMSLAPPDVAALRVAELCALSRPSVEELAKIDRRYIEAMTSSVLKSAHRTRLGEFLEPRNPVQALEKHRPALEIDRENIGSARGITRIAEVIDDAGLLLEAAAWEAEVVRDVERAAQLYVRAANHLAAASKSDLAVEALEKALRVFPESIPAASALHEILSLQGEFQKLQTVLSEAAQGCSSASIAAEHWIAVAKIFADENDDIPAAISALSRVDKAGVKSLPATLELAELYVRDRQWKLAVHHLTKSVELSPEPAVLLAVRVRLAEIYHEHLSQMIDATRELREILQIDSEHQGALRRLLAIQMKEKASSALQTAEKLSKLSVGPQKAEALVSLGRLFAEAGKKAEAIQSYASAVGIVGLEPADAAEGLCEILETRPGAKATEADKQGEGWAGYAKALATFCQGAKPGQHQARTYQELARVLSTKLKDDAQAIKALLLGLNANPSVSELRFELVRLLKKNRRHQEALPELLQLLRVEPLRVGTWSDIVEVYDATAQNAEAHLATGPLVLLGGGTELQKSSWAARKSQSAMLSEGAFDAEALASTLRQGVSLDGLALLAQISPLLPKVFPPDLAAAGASVRNKVGARGKHPARAALDRISHCFGGMEVDLYPSESADRIFVVFTDPVGLIVPDFVAELSDAEQVCYLGRFLANIARQVHAVDALSEAQLRLALGAALRLVDPSADVPEVDGSELAEATRRLSKSLPWLSKGRIEDAARKYAAAPIVDVGRFQRLLQLSGFRAGMILADDVAPIARLAQDAAHLVGERAEDVQAVMGDLLPYWASSEAVRLRQRLGIL